jgi:hypothetical protein
MICGHGVVLGLNIKFGYIQRINYVNQAKNTTTFPYNDFTPTFPASICLNADNTPSSVKPKPMILKDSKTLITGRYRLV